MPLISIIIPIYNNEIYLEKCLKSVADQLFTDYEVLMIDDGSNDNSSEICKRFSDSDNRFIYYYKDNGGVSSARNFGIAKAVGKYIAFIDSDDYIDNDYLSSLVKPLEKYDYSIIQSGIKLIRNNKESVLLPSAEFETSGKGYCETILKRELQVFLFQSPTSKLYNKKLLNDTGVIFDEKISISEDCLFNTELLNAGVEKVCFINYAGYNYLQDNSTLTKEKTSFEKVMQSLKVGIRTAAIRNGLIEKYSLQNDPDVIKGFSQAICIIYLSNAHQIETGNFTNEEKEKLYNTYFSVMNYPIQPSVSENKGTDKKIIEESFEKNYKGISRIYSIRQKKAKLKEILFRG